MTFDERISKMREKGVISPEQADQLAAAIDMSRAGRPTAGIGRSGRKFALIAAMLVVAFLLILLLLAVGDAGTVSKAPQDVSQIFNQPEEIGQMDKSVQGGFSIALILILPLLLVLGWLAWLHNALVDKEEAVFEAWAQVESNYQRRADLIPSVIEAVSDYMDYEQETLAEIAARRSAAPAQEQLRAMIDRVGEAQKGSADALGGIRGAPEDEATLERLSEAQENLGQSMHGLLALSENYPELRSSDQVLALEAELEGTENRINVARMRFNEAASSFNSAIRRMPNSLIASLGGFQRKAYFDAKPGAETPVSASLTSEARR